MVKLYIHQSTHCGYGCPPPLASPFARYHLNLAHDDDILHTKASRGGREGGDCGSETGTRSSWCH
jgi:hypothetical protein